MHQFGIVWVWWHLQKLFCHLEVVVTYPIGVLVSIEILYLFLDNKMACVGVGNYSGWYYFLC